MIAPASQSHLRGSAGAKSTRMRARRARSRGAPSRCCVADRPSADLPETNGKKSDPRRHTKDDEGPPSGTALPHRQGQCLLAEQEGWEEAPLRERGRLARILCVGWPLSFRMMWRPGTLPAGTAWARVKQSPGAVAGRAGWRRGVRLCQCCAGGTPALPGGPSSRDGVAVKEVHWYSCLFVSIRVHSWFVFVDDWVFHSRMIRPAGQGRCFPENRPAPYYDIGPEAAASDIL